VCVVEGFDVGLRFHSQVFGVFEVVHLELHEHVGERLPFRAHGQYGFLFGVHPCVVLVRRLVLVVVVGCQRNVLGELLAQRVVQSFQVRGSLGAFRSVAAPRAAASDWLGGNGLLGERR
jgi:hypothetical protein